MGHKVYISFKTEDVNYKDNIQGIAGLDYVDKSLNSPINSVNPDYVLQKIRSEYLSDSTVTIFLIGSKSSENLGPVEQQYIKGELQASLYNSELNPRNGILGIVLPEVASQIYLGTVACQYCGKNHNNLCLDDTTVIREFGYNFFIPNNRCSWYDADRYCQLTSWDNFLNEPERMIDLAFDQRQEPVASKVVVRPTRAGGF
jgi:hypothetical protein